MLSSQKHSMKISISKTKTSTVSKEPLRCKLEVQGKIIEQVMNFKYSGVEVTSDVALQCEITYQACKAARLSGCLNDNMAE